MKETYVLPNGQTTASARAHAAAYCRVAAPICEVLGWDVQAFDPGVRFREPSEFGIAVMGQADSAILLVTRRLWDMLTPKQRAELRAEGRAIRAKRRERMREAEKAQKARDRWFKANGRWWLGQITSRKENDAIDTGEAE